MLALESPDGKHLYYTKGRSNTSLWKVPVNGGKETQVLDSVIDFDAFSLSDEGVYFIPVSAVDGVLSIQFFDFASNMIRKVATIEGPLGFGITVSPDSRWLLYTRYEELGSDLMLVENLH